MALGRGGMVLRSFWLGESGFCFGVLLPPFIMQWQEGGLTRGAAAVLDVSVGKNTGKPTAGCVHITEGSHCL